VFPSIIGVRAAVGFGVEERELAFGQPEIILAVLKT